MENVVDVTGPPAGTIEEWGDGEWGTFKSWLKEVLYKNTAEVIFTKVDGSERRMNCTLRGDLIESTPKVDDTVGDYGGEGEVKPKPQRKPLKPNPHVLKVYDVDIKGWRSFRVQNITNIYQLILKYT